ncbi:MAG: hypothetical protein ACOC7R_01190 [Planctomycetota bacterium]
MNKETVRLTSWVVFVALLVATTGCGYILYPERRTRPLSDTIDASVVIFDCLWLLVGVVPGVVALIVDGTNDTWYYTEEELAQKGWADQQTRRTIPRGTEMQVRLHGPAPEDVTVALRLLAPDGTVLADSTTTPDPLTDLQALSLTVPDDTRATDGTLVLEVDGRRQVGWNVEIVE